MARSSPATKTASPSSPSFATTPRRKNHAVLVAFDLLELDGADLRGKPIEERKRRLAHVLRNAKPGLQLNQHLDEPGDVVFLAIHAPWGSKELFRSGADRATDLAARRIGSSPRIPTRRP